MSTDVTFFAVLEASIYELTEWMGPVWTDKYNDNSGLQELGVHKRRLSNWSGSGLTAFSSSVDRAEYAHQVHRDNRPLPYQVQNKKGTNILVCFM